MSDSLAISGRFLGDIITKWLDNGIHMEVIHPFAYQDSKGKQWLVPAGTHVDGASIPRGLWTIVGSPLTGLYRNASVVHDYFCDVHLEPWRAVHRVFYDAMLTSGVPAARAKLMYLAVYYGGPRWTDTSVHNTRDVVRIDLPFLRGIEQSMSIRTAPYRAEMRSPIGGESSSGGAFRDGHKRQEVSSVTLSLSRAEQLVEDRDPTLEDIDLAIDDILEQSGVSDTTPREMVFDGDGPVNETRGTLNFGNIPR
jgi:hypothetical protein